MNEAMQQEILKRLDGIGDKFGKAGLYSWDLLVRKVYWIDGWLGLGEGFVSLLIAWLALRGARFCWAKAVASSNEEDPWMFGAIACSAVVLFTTIGAIVSVFSAPARILMPDYYALQTILELLKK